MAAERPRPDRRSNDIALGAIDVTAKSHAEPKGERQLGTAPSTASATPIRGTCETDRTCSFRQTGAVTRDRGGSHIDPTGGRQSTAREVRGHAHTPRPRLARVLPKVSGRSNRAPSAPGRGSGRLSQDSAAPRCPIQVALQAPPGLVHQNNCDRLSSCGQILRHLEPRSRCSLLLPQAAASKATNG